MPSFHVKYRYNASILTADFILGIILNIGAKIGNSQVSKELSNAVLKMSEGEMLEIRMVKNKHLSKNDYIKVIENKTASVLRYRQNRGNFGVWEMIRKLMHLPIMEDLGIAYQIHDDLIDYNNEHRLFNILVKQMTKIINLSR